MQLLQKEQSTSGGQTDIRLELARDRAPLFLEPSSTSSATEVGSGLCWNVVMSEKIAGLVP
jgi:hypothetical protein